MLDYVTHVLLGARFQVPRCELCIQYGTKCHALGFLAPWFLCGIMLISNLSGQLCNLLARSFDADGREVSEGHAAIAPIDRK